MAPALTESTQTQNFVTSPPRTPSLSTKNYKKRPQILREALTRPSLSINGVRTNSTGMNGNSPEKKTLSINGIAKKLKNEFLPLNHVNEEPDDTDVAGSDLKEGASSIMSTSYIGDPDMGLQKSNKEINDAGEKISPEVDQILKNFSTVMNNEELNSNPELSQNVEEIIKAITNLDNTTTEIESGPSGDIETIFDNGLFNEADIMNMCVDETLVPVNKDTLISERKEEVEKKICQMRKKKQFLLRRMQKTVAHIVGKFAAAEITGVIEYSSKLLEVFRHRGFSPSELTGDMLTKLDSKPLSFSVMSQFMRQMEHAAFQQAGSPRPSTSRGLRYFGSGSSSASLTPSTNGLRLPGSLLPPLPAKVQQDLEETSGELTAQLTKLQRDIDSDVTESSSGCESCDEFIDYNNEFQHTLSISKRAGWRWAEERGQIAARLTWLNSQIADLDYRIRQQNDIKKNIRITKGPIKFEEIVPHPTPPNGCNTPEKGEASCSRTRGLYRSSFSRRKIYQLAGLHRVSRRAASMPSIRCRCRRSVPGCALCTGRSEPGQPTLPLPLYPIHQRISFIDPAFHPTLSFSNDSSSSVHYNAVLKCWDWQSKAPRIQGQGQGQQGASGGGREAEEGTSTAKPGGGGGRDSSGSRGAGEGTSQQAAPPEATAPGISPAAATAAASAAPDVAHYPRGRPPRPESPVNSSINVKRKLVRGKKRRKSNYLTLERYQKHRRKHSLGMSNADLEDEGDPDIDGNGDESLYPSPVSSPLILGGAAVLTPASKDKESALKRKRENSYDIDNIVIPYSMASSTRLEKLHYKEILTPKWRLVNKESAEEKEPKNGYIRRPSHETMEDDEDTSDEAYLSRHERSQAEEKKKFLSYLKLPGGLRGRAQRRTDSRADSSGPNTPDGMSPHEDRTGPTEEPPAITSPPLNSTACDSTETAPRKRTISSSLLTPVLPEVPPFEPRAFPLREDVYTAMVEMNEHEQEDPSPALNSSYKEGVEFASPGSVSTDSADSFIGDEDPNDPEWTSSCAGERSTSKR